MTQPGERRSVTFRVIGIAQPKGSAKAFVPKVWADAAAAANTTPRAIVTADNPRAKGWEQLVREQAQTVAHEGLFVGPIAVALVFHLPRPSSLAKSMRHHVRRPDVDKLARCCLDALTGVLYADDAAVVELRAQKRYAEPGVAPWVCITVAEAAAPAPRHSSLQLMLLEDSYAVQ